MEIAQVKPIIQYDVASAMIVELIETLKVSLCHKSIGVRVSAERLSFVVKDKLLFAWCILSIKRE